MQSCRLIPAMLLPPADPAGAKPRRDHRFLDRVSRHLMPKTPGNDDAFKVYDPARVSHIPVSQSVRHPSGVAGSLATPDPRVVGATPLDPGLKSGHPCRGASFTTLHNEWSGSCNTQMRHPGTIPRDRTCEEDCKYTTPLSPSLSPICTYRPLQATLVQSSSQGDRLTQALPARSRS